MTRLLVDFFPKPGRRDQRKGKSLVRPLRTRAPGQIKKKEKKKKRKMQNKKSVGCAIPFNLNQKKNEKMKNEKGCFPLRNSMMEAI